MATIQINGINNRRCSNPRYVEPNRSFAYAVASGVAMAIWVVGGLLIMAGMS